MFMKYGKLVPLRHLLAKVVSLWEFMCSQAHIFTQIHVHNVRWYIRTYFLFAVVPYQIHFGYSLAYIAKFNWFWSKIKVARKDSEKIFLQLKPRNFRIVHRKANTLKERFSNCKFYFSQNSTKCIPCSAMGSILVKTT